MIKVIIIDDEPLARSMVKEYLESYSEMQIAAECGDGFEGFKAIAEHKPDLIFLDIQMPKITGFEMLELLDQPPAVIFTTAFDEYALKAFETFAADYLLKPFSRERFDKAINRFLRLKDHGLHQKAVEEMLKSTTENDIHSERVVVKTGGKIRIIAARDIQYLEAADDYVKIHTATGTFLKNKTLSFFENSLPPDLFVRSHRSFVVNVLEITRIDNYEKDNHIAILRSGEKVPLSKPGYAKLREVLGV